MTDIKYKFAVKIVVAFVIGILIFAVLSPFITAFTTIMGVVPTYSGDFGGIVYTLITVVLPISAAFFGVFELIEVFVS